MKKLLLSFLVVLECTLAFGQSFSNLSFEYWQANTYPLFWQNQGLTVACDSSNILSGNYSIKAMREKSNPEQNKMPYGLIMQYVSTAYSLRDLENNKLEVSAKIKSELVDSTMNVVTFIQIIDRANMENSHISLGNNVAGKDWAESTASHTFKDISPSSIVVMGVILAGYGEAWIDDYKVKLDGEASNECFPRITDLTTKEKQWLEANLIPMSDDWLIDNKQFGKELRHTQIIGVGDNVHGSLSVFRLKNAVTKAMIQNEGFTVVAIEDSPDVGEFINRYILGLSDEIDRSSINIMYDNPDFKSFMTWLRDYNKSAVNKVRVFGVDINSRYEDLIDTLNQLLPGRYSSQLDSINSIFKMQIAKWESARLGKIPFSESQKEYITNNLQNVEEDITLSNMDESQKVLLTYYADNLIHYLTLDIEERERQMADNIKWIASQYPDEKIVYLAHNSHVGNQTANNKSAGAWLKEYFHDKYYIIGTCYFDGTDSYKKRTTANNTVINVSVKGSYEYLFNQISNNCFYLDLSHLIKNRNNSNEWLTKPMLMRNYGVEPFNYYHEFSITDLIKEYDGVVFIKTSVPL